MRYLYSQLHLLGLEEFICLGSVDSDSKNWDVLGERGAVKFVHQVTSDRRRDIEGLDSHSMRCVCSPIQCSCERRKSRQFGLRRDG